MIQHWHDPQQFDPVLNPFERATQITSNSLGLRVKGEVAGWCVSWSLGSGPDERRTASGARLFVRPALRQRGLAVMLLGEYLSRMPEAGLDYLIFSIFPENELMLRVLKKRLRPFLTGTREIWEVRKTFLQPFPPSSTPITCPVGAREE